MSALILKTYQSALLKTSHVRLDVCRDTARHRLHSLHSELTINVNAVQTHPQITAPPLLDTQI